MKLLRILSLLAAAAGLLILGACKLRNNTAPVYTQPDIVPSAIAPGAYIDSGK